MLFPTVATFCSLGSMFPFPFMSIAAVCPFPPAKLPVTLPISYLAPKSRLSFSIALISICA